MNTSQAVELAGKTRVANEKFQSTEEENKRLGQMALFGSEQKNKMDLQRTGAYQEQEKLKLANQLALPETTAKIDQANALAGYYGAGAGNINAMSPINQKYYSSLTNVQDANTAKTLFETDRDKTRNDILTPEVLKDMWGIGKSNSVTTGSRNDTLSPVNNSPRPITPTSTPTTDAAANGDLLNQWADSHNAMSSSLVGQTLGLPAINTMMQAGFAAGDKIGSGLSAATDFLTKPRKLLGQ